MIDQLVKSLNQADIVEGGSFTNKRQPIRSVPRSGNSESFCKKGSVLQQMSLCSIHVRMSSCLCCSLGKRYLHVKIKSGSNFITGTQADHPGSSSLLVCGELFGQRFRSDGAYWQMQLCCFV